ncbi:hypothetical protein [Ekhidna sp.]|uniref:hypothetical protein n=1 Tax=Ekhidna sp. TaxID=2608089 RepID=UPI003CCBACCA
MRLSLFVLSLAFGLCSLAQPVWVNSSSLEDLYPEKEFLVGYASLEKNSGPLIVALDDVKEFAILNLGESLYLEVVAASEGAESEFFLPNSISKQLLYDGGMVVETYHDSINQVVYAFAFLKKKELVKPVYLELTDELKQVKKGLDQMESDGDVDARTLSQLSTHLLIAKARSEVLPKLGIDNPVVLKTAQINLYDNLIAGKLSNAKKSSTLSIRDRLNIMVQSIVKESKMNEFQITPITYKNTDLVSTFSGYLEDELRLILPMQEVEVKEDSKFKLISSYWLKDENVLVAFSLKQFDGDEAVKVFATESVFIPKSDLLEKGLIFYPDERHISRVRSEFLLNQANGGVQVDLVTQKGTRRLVFESGDKLSLYVSATRPVFITLLNIWDDGTQVLMMENYYIGKDRINQAIELPFEWNVKCPCGTEYIKLIAEKNPLIPMLTEKNEDGFKVVVKDFQENIKGVRDRQQTLQGSNKNYYFGESHLVITTTQ